MEHTTEDLDGVSVIRPLGDIDVTSAIELRAVLAERLSGERPRLVLDLGGVPFVDSSGIGVLVSANRRATQAGGALVLAALGPGVLKVLELTRTIRVFRTAGSVDEAVAELTAEA